MTTVAVTLEQRFDRKPDGTIWTSTFDYGFWTRYLEVFSDVRVIARVRDVGTVPNHYRRADGDGVGFAGVPFYRGVWGYTKRRWSVNRAIRAALRPGDAVILQIDSQIASVLDRPLRQSGRPYGVEVVADPHDVFAPGAFEHPLRPFLRWWFQRKVRHQVARASAASFVTERALQRRYPPAALAFTTHCSSVQLPDQAFVSTPRTLDDRSRCFVLVTVQLLDHLFKAPDVILDALRLCVDGGLDLHVVLVGDGSHRAALEERASRLGLSHRVTFTGLLSREDVREQLDRADLFVLPSRADGLPRALIEAMARALPAIGSNLGGFRELLPERDLVAPGDPDALATAIHAMVANRPRMAAESARNLVRARDFHESTLRVRRIAFHSALKASTDRFWTRV